MLERWWQTGSEMPLFQRFEKERLGEQMPDQDATKTHRNWSELSDEAILEQEPTA